MVRHRPAMPTEKQWDAARARAAMNAALRTYFTGRGYLEVEITRSPTAGAGLPSKDYRAAARGGRASVPVRHCGVLSTLLWKGLARLPREGGGRRVE